MVIFCYDGTGFAEWAQGVEVNTDRRWTADKRDCSGLLAGFKSLRDQ